jgi:lipopolysaccharide export system protein LptC
MTRWLNRLIAWSPVLLLGALAALTYWLNAQVQGPSPAFDGSRRHDPDLFIENFKAISLGPTGEVRQALSARVARHFPDDDTTELEAPVITLSDPGKPRLSVTSNRASVTADQNHAYFTGKVKAVRDATAADAREGPMTIESEFLHVIPKEDKIVTDKAVTITDSRGIINATGMEIDNKAKTIKLQSRVSGRLQPQK